MERDPVSGLAFPTIADVWRARAVVTQFLPPTPFIASAALDERLGFHCRIKCENLQPIGAFKVRGGLTLMDVLTPEERARGVVSASTGNHGQSIAYAANIYGVAARVYMPERANPLKVASMERLGARVIGVGADFDACRLAAEADARETGALYIEPANEPRLIAGVGTCALEMLETDPELDAIFVPAGGGSGASAAGIVAGALAPQAKVIAVGATGAPALYDGWRSGDLVAYERTETFAEGVATRVAASLPVALMRRHLHDFRLVSDAEMRRAILTLLETTRMLAEGAGAAALAAAYAMRHELAGRNVGVVLSGGNFTLESLAETLATEQPW
ncbi:MAG: pyridoxal-phosphate dependent enzyme [Thermomicrobiales bacterium]|nr:pyridoxal-phosphate dependent enzyme [Thermomicrobiales bacterium]